MSEADAHGADRLDDDLQREVDEALGGMSLEDIVAMEEGGRPPGREGVVRGKVVAIHGDDIFVDIGSRSEALLPAGQFRDDPLPEVGEVIEVAIEGYDEAEGITRVSRQGAVQAATWETLEVGQIVEGVVAGQNRGGLELKIGGVWAFMPISQIERFHVDDLAAYVGQKLQCMVSEVDRREGNVVVSRRELLEIEAEQRRRELWETLAEGQTVAGTVRSVMPYGAFVDIGGIDGLLHVSDLSWGRVEDPASVVQEGQAIDVMVLKVDRDTQRVSLGLKQILRDPWDGAEGKWPVHQLATGRVTRLMDFGAFVELEPGVEGLIPISEMSFRRIGKAGEVVAEGDVVKAVVLNVDVERHRIALSLKRAGDDPWMGASVRWPADSVVSGTVTRTADFGAFVELTPGVEGLVHISELADQHVRAVSDVVRPGQQVQAKVLDVDEERRRISLSIKQAGAAATELPPSPPPQRRSKRPLKGGLD